MAPTIKINFFILFNLAGKEGGGGERQREREREMETERASGKGAESVLTSIQEEDILSFYAAHVIFIA